MTLSAKSLRWSRGGHLVVDDVTIAPVPGETIGLLGPNGSGKSSLLRLLAGVDRPDSGAVTLDGTDIHSLGRRTLACRVAMVGQHAHTEVDIRVRDVVRLGRIPHADVLGRDDGGDAAIAHALEVTGMTEHADRLWRAMSGGERQRAQIARALAQEPEELLLDEPTNHLDLDMREALAEALAVFDGAIVLVSHDRHLIGLVCDTFWRVADGRAVPFDGDLDEYAAWLRSRDGDKAAERKEDTPAPAPAPVATPKRRKGNPHKLAKAEARVGELEEQLSALEAELADPGLYTDGGNRAGELAKRQAELRTELEAAEEALLELYADE